MEDEPLERVAPSRRDEEPQRPAARQECLLDRVAAGDDLLARAEDRFPGEDGEGRVPGRARPGRRPGTRARRPASRPDPGPLVGPPPERSRARWEGALWNRRVASAGPVTRCAILLALGPVVVARSRVGRLPVARPGTVGARAGPGCFGWARGARPSAKPAGTIVPAWPVEARGAAHWPAASGAGRATGPGTSATRLRSIVVSWV
ncbi:MAG TPA: hypothetical protein VLM76_04210, partial [Patescibacteria group bacterium]|nr:hypothetical protein [Patescibacteria group bacterium]